MTDFLYDVAVHIGVCKQVSTDTPFHKHSTGFVVFVNMYIHVHVHVHV